MAVVMMEMRVGADSPALPDAQQLLSQVGFGTSGMAENKKKLLIYKFYQLQKICTFIFVMNIKS